MNLVLHFRRSLVLTVVLSTSYSPARRKAPGLLLLSEQVDISFLVALSDVRCSKSHLPHPAVSQPTEAWLSQGAADRAPNPAQRQLHLGLRLTFRAAIFLSHVGLTFALEWIPANFFAAAAGRQSLGLCRMDSSHLPTAIPPKEPGGHGELGPQWT